MSRLFFLLLIIASIGFAPSIEFEVGETSCPETLGILEVLFNLPTCIVEEFFTTLIDGFVYTSEQFLENALNFITATPDIGLFCEPYAAVMDVLESLYTLAFMGVGAFYILKSHDIEGRASARFWLKNIFLMIVALSFSFPIFEMILEINEYITTSLYGESFDDLLDIESASSSLVFALALSFSFFNMAGLIFMTLLIRYISIPFLLLLFPIGIFLYFLPFTKDWGAFAIRVILIIIFMTSIDAIIVLAMSYLFSAGDPNLAGGFVAGLALMLGFGLIGVINVIIYFVAFLSILMAVGRIFGSVLSVGWKLALMASLL